MPRPIAWRIIRRRLASEEEKECPNQARIDQLREASLAIALEPRSLSMTDDGVVARFAVPA